MMPARLLLAAALPNLMSCSVACTLSILVAAGAGAPTIVDNFEEASFGPLIDTDSGEMSGGVVSDQTGLSTSNVAGSRRFTFLELLSGESASASLSLADGDDGVEFLVNSNSSGLLFFIYQGPIMGSLNTDLTAGGADRFEITLSDAQATGTLIVGALANGVCFENCPIIEITGPGSYTVLFSEMLDDDTLLPLDFSDTDTVYLTIEATAGATPLSFTISNIAAVPEPTTALLLATGLARLAARRRKVH